MQHSQHENRGLADTSLGLSKNILPLKSHWDALLLNCTRALGVSERHTELNLGRRCCPL